MNISQNLKDSLLARGENGASTASSIHDIVVTRDFSALFEQMATQSSNNTFPQMDVEEVESITSPSFGMMTSHQDQLSRMKLQISELAQEGYSWESFESLQERVNEQERWERLLEFVDKRIQNDFNLKENELSTTDFEKLMEQLFTSLDTDYDFESMSQNGYDTVLELLESSGVTVPEALVGELTPLNRLWEMYQQNQEEDLTPSTDYTVISNTGYSPYQNRVWKEMEVDTTFTIPTFQTSQEPLDLLEEVTLDLEKSQTQLGKFLQLHTQLVESGYLFMV